MDFDLTEEQRLLKESVDRVVDDAYGDFEKRKEHQRGPRGFSDGLWSTYAELGLLGMPFEERHGGFGGGPVETMIVMEAIGRGLVVEPYLATVVLGGRLLRVGGSESQRERADPQDRRRVVTLAFAISSARRATTCTTWRTTARRTARRLRLDGAKGVVLHGGVRACWWSARALGGARRDREGYAVPGRPQGARRARRAIRHKTGCARRRSPSTGYGSGRGRARGAGPRTGPGRTGGGHRARRGVRRGVGAMEPCSG